MPNSVGKTGDRGFCTDENNTIRYDPGGWNQLHTAYPVMWAKVVLVASFLCAPLVAQENDALVRKVDDHYNHLSSLRAHYTESYAGMGMDRVGRGYVAAEEAGADAVELCCAGG